MPVVVVVLLALICLGMLGFACGCLSDQRAAAVERAVQAPALMPALVELWPALLFAAFAAGLLVYTSRTLVTAAACPAVERRDLEGETTWRTRRQQDRIGAA